MDFKRKYLKYKYKYLELKKQIGGTPIEINDEIKEYIKKWVSIENIACRHGDNSPLDIGNKLGFRSFIDDSNWKVLTEYYNEQYIVREIVYREVISNKKLSKFYRIRYIE